GRIARAQRVGEDDAVEDGERTGTTERRRDLVRGEAYDGSGSDPGAAANGIRDPGRGTLSALECGGECRARAAARAIGAREGGTPCRRAPVSRRTGGGGVSRAAAGPTLRRPKTAGWDRAGTGRGSAAATPGRAVR